MDTNRLFEFLANHWILSSLLVVILIALAIDPLLRRLRGIRSVSVVEATRLINQENAQVIDIREEKEFSKGHLLDSQNIPLSKLSKRLETLNNLKGQPLLIVWATGQRAVSVAGQLYKQGHKPIYLLQGGIESWREANMPLFSSNAKATAKPKEKVSVQPQPEPQADEAPLEPIPHSQAIAPPPASPPPQGQKGRSGKKSRSSRSKKRAKAKRG
jgi:rhodanese-related sulfurtransferase